MIAVRTVACPSVERAALAFERECLADPRGWVPACGGITGCGGHHGALDVARTITVLRAALPPELEEFATELGLTWWLDRTYGRSEREDAA